MPQTFVVASPLPMFTKHYAVTQELIPSALRSRAYTRVTLALTLGTRLGVYEVTAQIGVGGMGEVYKATDTNLKRAVATKVKEDADYGSDPTQDTENGRRGDGDGRSAARVCSADWARRSCHVLLRKRPRSHPL